MCGVLAYYAYHHAARPLQRAAVSQVLRALRVRGPDGEGEWFSDDARVALGHTRLAVIGPGSQGHQPMVNAQQTQVLSFNGAIYNHAQLRTALELRGHQFHGDSDTEVLLAMYCEHGEEMLAQLRGMFAFALWDSARDELILARDAYGIKPLYYADDGRTARVASQVAALRCDAAISDEPDPAGWAGFYLLGSVPEPFTTYRAIRAVPAGALVRIGKNGVLPAQKWFDFAAVVCEESYAVVSAGSAVSTNSTSDGLDQSTLRQALLDSVRAHFVADVPVGLFLSSGLDSAVLLALACELGYRPQTLTLAFDEFAGTANDESVLAARLAADLGVEHHIRRVSAAEFNEQIPLILDAMDQPSIDGVNTWFASKAAAELGLKVALCGVGGDELMAGYPSFRQLPWLARLGMFPGRIPGLRDLLTRLAVPLTRRLGWHPKLAGLFSLVGSYERAWLLQRGLYMPWELTRLMGEDNAARGMERLQPLAMLAGLLNPYPRIARARVSILESAMYLRNQLLRDADWAGMAHGVEIRTPLVDVALLRSLAPQLMQRTGGAGKDELAQLPARRLPPAMLSRPKTGFQVPMQMWLHNRGDVGAARMPKHVAAIRAWAQQVAGAQ